MCLKPYGYVQLAPPLLNAVAEGNIDSINAWRNIGLASVDPNLWGLRRFRGLKGIDGRAIVRAVKGFGIDVEVRLSLDGVQMNPWEVVGYPEVIYGLKPWEYSDVHPHTPKTLELPMAVGEIPAIVSYTRYSIKRYDTGLNLAYDIWLMRSPSDMACSKGDIELMIWLFRDRATPAGKVVETIEVPAYIDGGMTRARFDVWLEPELPAPPGTPGRWVYIAFVLSNPIREGSIAIDLANLISATGDLLAKHCPDEWSREKFDRLYLRSIELGAEVFYSPKIDVEWVLNEYHLIALPLRLDASKSLRLALSLEGCG